MAFAYRLERVMKIVESEKNELEIEYRELFDQFDKVAHRLIELLNHKEVAESDIQNQMKQPVTIDFVRLKSGEVEKLDRLIARQSVQYRRLKDQVDRLRSALQAKSVEVKKYEKIKERQSTVYHRNEKKAEMKRMDESASIRAVHHS